MTIKRLVLGVAFLLTPICTALAAPYVVAEARGISIAVGSILDSTKPIELKQGQHLVLISSSGETIKLSGPYHKAPVDERGVELASAFSGLLTERNARTSEIGTTRGVSPRPDLPQPWLIDASGPGTACLKQGGTPVLWRPDAKEAAEVVVTPADRSWKATAKWPAGANDLQLKPDMGVRGDASYFIILNGSEVAVRIANVPDVLSTDKMRAAWMLQKGCVRQAEALLRSIQ